MKKTSLNNNILLLEKLTGKKVVLENPDTTMRTFEGVRNFQESDAVPFGIVGNEMFVGKLGRMHAEIKYMPDDRKFPLETRRKYERAGFGTEDYDYPGRVWMIGNLLSFYEYPESQAKLFEILTKLQEELKIVHDIDIDLVSKSYVEIYVDRLTNKLVFPHETKNKYRGSALILAKDYDAALKGTATLQKTEFQNETR